MAAGWLCLGILAVESPKKQLSKNKVDGSELCEILHMRKTARRPKEIMANVGNGPMNDMFMLIMASGVPRPEYEEFVAG